MKAVYDTFKEKLVKAYGQLRIGNPLDINFHVGPLIDTDAVKMYLNSIEQCKQQGGNLLWKAVW
jgi:aldehyde dehydrogenase (NAD+)